MAEPSSGTETAVTADLAAAKTDANQTAAATSGADDTGAKQPTSILDAALGALKPEPAVASPAATTETKDGTEAATADKAAVTAEDDKPPPFHEHPAWKRQLAKTAERDATITALQPKAQAFDAMAGMVHEAGLTKEEVDAGFNIMTLMKNDPAKAYETLKPYMASLEKVVGITLPDDLSDRVAKGFITEDDARREAKTRAEAGAATARASRTEQQRQHDAAQTVSDQTAATVSQWEVDWQKSDPDFARKQPFVLSEVHALRALHGAPKTAVQALELVKTARKNVEDRMKALLPAKAEVKSPVTSESSAKVSTAPTNIREAAAAGLRAARAA